MDFYKFEMRIKKIHLHCVNRNQWVFGVNQKQITDRQYITWAKKFITIRYDDDDKRSTFLTNSLPFSIDEPIVSFSGISTEMGGSIKQTKSMIIIWPNREMYQEVEHQGELNFFELIGCLGGHAHIWLGLSIIQFYDVFADIISRARYRWQLIGQKFGSIRTFFQHHKNHWKSITSNFNRQR